MKAGPGAALLLCLAAVPAWAQGPCLQFNRIESFKTLKANDLAVIATDSLRNRYKLTLRQRCTGFDFDLGAGIRSPGSSRQACVAPGDEFVARNPALRGDRCSIARIEVYTPAMEAADRAAAH